MRLIVIKRVIVALLIGQISGCLFVPIPTPEFGEAPIEPEQIAVIEAGVGRINRDFVLESIGQPQESFINDRIHVYSWARSQGMYFLLIGTSMAGGAGESQHRFCLRYSETGELVEVAHFDSAISSTDDDLNRLLEKWVGEIVSESPDPRFARLADASDLRSFANAARVPLSVGVVLDDRDSVSKQCFRGLVPAEPSLSTFELRSYQASRDQVYPWLEPPLEERIVVLAQHKSAQEAFKNANMRYLVDANFAKRCSLDTPSVAACFEAQVGKDRQWGSVMLVSLDDANLDHSGAAIPIFPSNAAKFCEATLPYVAYEIQRLALGQ